MKKIVLASNNKHKVEEIQSILKNIQIVTLDEIGFTEEIDEIANTFEGNAMLKAITVFDETQLPVFADDSGLEVEALNGAPGVFSKRYVGTGESEDNIAKLLNNLKEVTNRKAQFRTVLCFFDGKKEHYFEGIIRGTIIHEKRGTGGFGYDPVFVPKGYDKTFAELGSKIKNSMSHRALAIQQFLVFYEKNFCRENTKNSNRF